MTIHVYMYMYMKLICICTLSVYLPVVDNILLYLPMLYLPMEQGGCHGTQFHRQVHINY